MKVFRLFALAGLLLMITLMMYASRERHDSFRRRKAEENNSNLTFGPQVPERAAVQLTVWAALLALAELALALCIACCGTQVVTAKGHALMQAGGPDTETFAVRTDQEATKLPFCVKAHWVLYYLATCSAAIVFFGFWCLVYLFVNKEGVADLVLFQLHGATFVYYMVNVFLVRIPYKGGHFYIPLTLLLIYIAATAIAYAITRESEVYPVVLDYEGNPLVLAGVVVLMGVIAPLLAHLFFYCLSRLRDKCISVV